MLLSLGILYHAHLQLFQKKFCSEVFEIFVILLAILLPIKSHVASAVFFITLFELVLSASVADYLATSKSFWLYLPLKFLLILLIN